MDLPLRLWRERQSFIPAPTFVGGDELLAVLVRRVMIGAWLFPSLDLAVLAMIHNMVSSNEVSEGAEAERGSSTA